MAEETKKDGAPVVKDFDDGGKERSVRSDGSRRPTEGDAVGFTADHGGGGVSEDDGRRKAVDVTAPDGSEIQRGTTRHPLPFRRGGGRFGRGGGYGTRGRRGFRCRKCKGPNHIARHCGRPRMASGLSRHIINDGEMCDFMNTMDTTLSLNFSGLFKLGLEKGETQNDEQIEKLGVGKGKTLSPDVKLGLEKGETKNDEEVSALMEKFGRGKEKTLSPDVMLGLEKGEPKNDEQVSALMEKLGVVKEKTLSPDVSDLSDDSGPLCSRDVLSDYDSD